MSLTKTTEISKIEVVGTWNIQVATDTVIKEDGNELSRSRHRHVLTPYYSSLKMKKVDGANVPDLDSNGKKQWVHEDVDISKESSQVKAIANVIWTDDVKTAYKTWKESQEV